MGLFGMTLSYLAFAVAHFLQLVLGIAVIGLYAQDLKSAGDQGKYTDTKWAYAVVVGSIASFSAIVLMIPFIMRFAFVWVWNLVIFILYIALFGIFAKLFLHEDPEGNAGIQRMKNAVWVDLTNALLWLFTALGGFVYWWTHRERHSRFTGRAQV